MLELDGMNGDFVCRKFAWGPDLSSSLEGAGGIGGLLAIEDPNDPNDGTDVVGSFLVCYDGNGNVTQLIDWPAAQTAGSIDPNHVVAHYEYSPFGRVSRASGTYAWDNPFRFSTKWFDNETGLGYWGYRYYSPDLGRWITRDSIGNSKGFNVYAYSHNIPINKYDSIGLCDNWVGDVAMIVSWLEGGDGYGKLVNSTTNKRPPMHLPYSAGGTLSQLVSSKDFRNILTVRLGILCCGGRRITTSQEYGSIVGYTNLNPGDPMHFPLLPFGLTADGIDPYFKGKSETDVIVEEGEDSITLGVRSRFQVSDLFNVLGQPLNGGRLLPWAWSEIVYQINCKGEIAVYYNGSSIPSHDAYYDGWRVGYYSMDSGNRVGNMNNLDNFLSKGIDGLGDFVRITSITATAKKVDSDIWSIFK